MKKIKRILIGVELFVFVLCLGLLISSGVKNLQAEQQYEELRKSVTNNEATEIEEVNTEGAEEGIDLVESDLEWRDAIERRRLFPIDFAALNETNPDVVGWIQIEGSEVDYPIMCSPTDDAYYLNHNIYGEELQPGAIYIEKINDSGFDDSHTVIYGHNQKDQSMFGSLHRYEERSYLQENPSIVIYTENYEKRTYLIFSSSQIGDEHLLAASGMNTDKMAFEEYLKQIQSGKLEKQILCEDVEVTKDDRIITLSTCENGGQDDKRYVVQAVLKSVEYF